LTPVVAQRPWLGGPSARKDEHREAVFDQPLDARRVQRRDPVEQTKPARVPSNVIVAVIGSASHSLGLLILTIVAGAAAVLFHVLVASGAALAGASLFPLPPDEDA